MGSFRSSSSRVTRAESGAAGETTRSARRSVVRIGSCAFALALVMSTVAIVTSATTPSVAAAATTAVAATWSSSPNTAGFVTATPPVGTLSATLTLSGGGGGGGGTNSSSATALGGAGAQISGTLNLTHNTGVVAVQLGGGGGAGSNCNSSFSSCTASASSGGAGYVAGGGGGQAQSESVSVQGAASGGGGGGASALFLGSNGSGTRVAIAAGGGGSGGQHGCDSTYSNGGTGGAGFSTASGATSAGVGGGSSGDGEGGGSAGAAGGAASAGTASGANNGGHEANSTAGGGGGGAGGGGGNGGEDNCTTGKNSSGGGGGGASAGNTTYFATGPTYAAGGAGGNSGSAGAGGGVTLTWNVDNLSQTAPNTQNCNTGVALSPLQVPAATYDTTGGNSVTYSATGLPPGVSISSSGSITGTATTPGTYSPTITATDSEGLSATSPSFTWLVTNIVTVTNPGTKSNVSGAAITPVTNSATDSQTGATLTWSATGLPAGLSINSSTGTISGTPTTAGSNSVVVKATDGSGFNGTAAFSWTITNNVSVTNPGNKSNVSGAAITPVTNSATDSQTGATLTWSATGLPAGLSINSSTGTISGTPTTAGSNSVTIKATDGSGFNGTAAFSWTITNNVSVTNPGSQSSLSGSAIASLSNSATDSQTGSTLTWSATGLPAGLSINSSTGTISGTPTTAGTWSVTITATDGGGFHGSATFSWTVTNNISVTNPGSQSNVSGSAIASLTNSATDSQTGSTLTWTATGLPAGLSINSSTGTISGTPTTAGTSSVTITATDGGGFHGSATFSWTVTNTVSVTNPGAQSSGSGSAITALTDSAADSQAGSTLTWTVTGLPAGLSINSSTGTISGTPTTAGTYPVTITATDGSGFHGSATFSWTVTNTVTVTRPGNQSSVSGSAVSPVGIAATDSSSTATLAYAAANLPAGLSINSSTGVISGTPTTAGTYSVGITVTDSGAFTGATSFTWTITNTVSITSPGNQSGVSGSSIIPFTVSGTDSSSTTSLVFTDGGSLPAGVSIDAASGTISGTPTTAASYPVTITATDGAGFSASTSFTWTVTNRVSVADPGDQADQSGVAISPLAISASDSSSTATLSYSDGGTLPAGLSIDPATGHITGTPTTKGTSSVTITASDNAGFSASTTFNWSITNTISVTNPGDQSDVSGSAITALPIVASDSSPTATLSYSDDGTLPAGLSIDPATGQITGTPTTGGTSNVTITVTDDADSSAAISFTWTITNTVSVISPGDQSTVSGAAITPVTVSASDSSSTATLSYSDGGTLPAGLSIDPATGHISGTPTTAGSYPVTITATDNASSSGSITFDWTVTNTVSVTSPGDQSDVSGTAIATVPVAASDSSSTATLSYSDGGTLPAGLTIDPTTGQITGTPTTGASSNVTITATDGAGFTGSASFTWTITNTVSVASPGDQSSLSGAAISNVPVSATDSDPSATLTYSDGGTLPAGLSIDAASGIISGTPTTAGSYPVTITATDGGGYSGTATFNWTVTNGVSVTSPGDQTDGSGAPIAPVTITASDSSSGATLSYSDGGTLPAGLSIDPASGTISGTPTTAGSYPVTITVTDTASFAGSASFTWTITNTVSVTSPGDQTDGSGAAITAVPVAASDSSSTATLSYSDGGTLPTGLSIDPSSGTISGTPTTAGTYPVTITVTDDSGATGTATFNWTITNTVSVTGPGDQTDGSGTAITAVPVAASDSSSTATLSYSDGGTLPPGLTIDPASGQITGTPTTGGSYPVTITVTDDSGATGTATFNWTITNTVSVTGPGDQSDVSGTAITAVPVSASDSDPSATLTYSDGGTLPPGLSIDPSSGQISGTPTLGGTFPVTITATDGWRVLGICRVHLDHHQHGDRGADHQPVGLLRRPGHPGEGDSD